MANEARLHGVKVLVVEDDFHLAIGIEEVLRKAGADLLGPVAHEDQALDLIAGQTPTCAIIDINLGNGARFNVADALKARNIPFMFMTGYDDVMIPVRFKDVGRMRKPAGFRLVVDAAVQLCSQRAADWLNDGAGLEYMAISSTGKPLAGPPTPANASTQIRWFHRSN